MFNKLGNFFESLTGWEFFRLLIFILVMDFIGGVIRGISKVVFS